MTKTLAESNRVFKMNVVDIYIETQMYGQKPPKDKIPADVNGCGGFVATINIDFLYKESYYAVKFTSNMV